MNDTKWTKRWKTWVAPTRTPGVWKRKEGGFLVRVRAVDPVTGQMREIRKVMPDADEAVARRWLDDERARVKSGEESGLPRRQRFCDFAEMLFKEKVASGDIKTLAGQHRWKNTLVHLIGGTKSADEEVMVKGFGQLYLDQIRAAHVDAWRVGIGTLIRKGAYAPTTANSWFAILRVIDKAAKRRFELPRRWTEDVPDFDLSEHVIYTDEAPNALPPEKVSEFLTCMEDLFPQHFAMTFLGFATGLRPSSMRPLRRKGDTCDVLWDEGRIRVRRSQTVGNSVMNSTKQRTRYGIDVPPEVMQVLRWHVDTQLVTPEQQDSDLLFPSVTGGFRTVTALMKPFRGVAEAMKLGFPFTPRGMRRTFNDLARAASIEAIVTRSISGHLTERMQEHYSTVRGSEQRDGIAKVVDLMKRRKGAVSE